MRRLLFELDGPHISYAMGINAQRDIAMARRLIERRVPVDAGELADPTEAAGADAEGERRRKPTRRAAMASDKKERVGIVGVGRMGHAMLKHLVKHGYQVTACDVSAEALAKARATPAPRPRIRRRRSPSSATS